MQVDRFCRHVERECSIHLGGTSGAADASGTEGVRLILKRFKLEQRGNPCVVAALASQDSRNPAALDTRPDLEIQDPQLCLNHCRQETGPASPTSSPGTQSLDYFPIQGSG